MKLLESAELKSLVADLMQQHEVPGLSVAVVHKGVTSSTGFGLANVEDEIPCTGDTLFDIASCAKSLTAASVALLVDDEKHPSVQYTALVSDILPDDFVMGEKSYTEGVTVEDILSHRTGMAGHDSACMGPEATHPDNAKSVTRNLRNLKPAAPLRSRYLYCNQMFTVATHLVEETTGKCFSDFLDESVFTPLKMESTTLQPSRAVSKGWSSRMAKGYIGEADERRAIDAPDCPEGQGAGSVISSANDFIKYVKALLYQEDPINRRVYRGLTKMRSIVDPMCHRLKPHTTPAMYTAGTEMHFYREKMVIGHDGNIPGFASRFAFMPDLEFGVVAMGNSSRAAGAVTTIIRWLMDAALEVPIDDRVVPPRQKKGKKKPQKQSPNGNQEQKQKQTPHQSQPPQTVPLGAYSGTYWDAGYHTMVVEVKDGQLFIDATDRSAGFTLTFEHVKDDTEFIAHLWDDVDFSVEPVDAEFVLDENKNVVRMGLDLEPALKELIWFERQNGAVAD